MQVKAGIIGFGYMGNYHLKKAGEVDGLTVVSAYDTQPDRREEAGAAGLRVHQSLDAFLEDDDISLVLVCTPNQFHAELSIAALEAGKHVMCEKPVTMNAAELERVLEAARRNRRVFTAHQNRRWDADYLTVREVVGRGDIGSVTTIESRVYGQRGVCYGWRADPAAGGGMLYDWGIHLIDQMLHLFRGRKVTSVYARLQRILTPAVDDDFELQMGFDNGICARLYVGTFCLQQQPRWFVFGDRGTLMLRDLGGESGGMARIRGEVEGFDSVFGKQCLGPSRTMAPLRPENLETLPLPFQPPHPYAYHLNLVEAVRGNQEPAVSHEDMRRAMGVVDLAFESSRKNEVMKVCL